MQTASAVNPPVNWALLGGLRFALALVVVLGHTAVFIQGSPIVAAANHIGPYPAVFAFFVISGYSIAPSVLKHGRAEFYVRRFRRIAPVWYPCVALAICTMVWQELSFEGPSGPISMTEEWPVIAALLGLTNIIAGPLENLTPAWSLGLEIAYYAMAPFLLLLSRRWLTVLLLISVTCYVMTVSTSHGYFWRIFVTYWAWLLGFMLYRWPRRRWVQTLVLVAPGALWTVQPYWPAKFGVIMLATSSALIIYNQGFKLSGVAGRLAAYLGDLSFPLYLVHMPVFYLVWIFTKERENALPYWGFVLGATLLLHHVFERPYHALVARKERRARSLKL